MTTKLTIGAWSNKVPGTIGIGLEPGPACDKIINSLALDNFYAEFSVNEIFSFDMIEHIPTKLILNLFMVWHKVLTFDGRIEIGTQDLESLCNDFLSSDFTRRKSLINHFYGSQSFQSDFHLTGYTFEILKDYLEQAGFKNVRRCDSLYKNWCGSLIVEAFKSSSPFPSSSLLSIDRS